MHGQRLSTPESVIIGDPFLPPALSVQYMEHVNIFMQSFKRNGQNQSQQKGWAVPSALRAFLGFLFFHVLPSSLAVCVHLLPLLLCFNCKCRGIGSVILTCAGPELLALML